MNKRLILVKEALLILLCFIIAMGIRIYFLSSDKIEVTDAFQYYQASMIREESREPVMTSAVAFAYTENLSNVLKFTGNRPEAIAGYHIILQMAAYLFLFLGCRFLFGRAAAFFEVVVFAVSPWLIKGIWQVSPENFYLVWWSFLFFLIGVLNKKNREKGWYRQNKDEIFLTILGFLIGVICIWHFMGFFLLLFIIYAIVSNMSLLIEKRKIWKNTSIMESLLKDNDKDEEEEEYEEVMPVSSQVLILCFGIFLGCFCTLMKYTGVTGEFLKDQFAWWQEQLFCGKNGRWQDIFIWLPVWLMTTIFVGACLQFITEAIYRKKEKNEEKQETVIPEKMKEETMEKKDEKKKIDYIENPLPLPKKHVKRKFDFALDKKKEGFDIEIDENDDFDI